MIYHIFHQGHCESDSDCRSPGWLVCGNDAYTDNNYFPLSDYNNLVIDNSAAPVTGNYFSTDNCCGRRCHSRYHLCGDQEVGCLRDDDCQPGLFCNTDLEQPRWDP